MTEQTTPIEPDSSEAPAPMNPRVVGALVVACLAILVFIPTITYDFLSWDDYMTVAKNPSFNPPPGDSVDIGHYWAHSHMDMYAPLTYTLWGLLAGQAHTQTPDPDTGITLNPMIFHAINVLLHAAAALVVLALLRRIFENEWICVLGASLFAIHPLQVESVAWISGTKDVLAGLLGLVALWQYLRYAQLIKAGNEFRESEAAAEPIPVAPVSAPGSEGASPSQEVEEEPKPIELNISPIGSLVIATICFILAMLAKPSAVAIPFLAIVLDYFIVGRRFSEVIKPTIIWIILTIPIIVIAWHVQPAHYANSPVFARPIVVLDSLAWYVYKLFIPWHYAVDYGRSPQWLMSSAQKYWTWIVPVVLAIIGFLTYRKFRWLAISMLLFACALIPVLGFFRFDYQIFSTVADHYVYVAMLGPAILLCGILAWLRSDVWLRVASVLVALLAIRSFMQVRTWADTLTLFTHTLEVNPNSFAAHMSLGEWWSRTSDRDLGLAQQARARGEMQTVQQAMQDAQAADATATEQYQAALKIKPDDAYINFDLGNAMMRAHRLPEAVKYLRRAIDVFKPDSNHPEETPARFYLNLGAAEGMQGHAQQAADAFQKVLEYYESPDIRVNLGNALVALGKRDEARKNYQRALQLDPQNRRALERLYLLSQLPATTQATKPTTTQATKSSTTPKK